MWIRPEEYGNISRTKVLGLLLSLSAAKQPSSAHRACQRRSATFGSKRPLISTLGLARNGRAAEVASARQNDVLELLDGGRGNRRIDPGAVLVDLASGRNPKRIGAKIGIKYRDGQFDPFSGRLGVRVPV